MNLTALDDTQQVLIEEQLQACVARPCSGIAANAGAARTWSDDNSGKSATISPAVMLDNDNSTTSYTVMRVSDDAEDVKGFETSGSFSWF